MQITNKHFRLTPTNFRANKRFYFISKDKKFSNQFSLHFLADRTVHVRSRIGAVLRCVRRRL